MSVSSACTGRCTADGSTLNPSSPSGTSEVHILSIELFGKALLGFDKTSFPPLPILEESHERLVFRYLGGYQLLYFLRLIDMRTKFGVLMSSSMLLATS